LRATVGNSQLVALKSEERDARTLFLSKRNLFKEVLFLFPREFFSERNLTI